MLEKGGCIGGHHNCRAWFPFAPLMPRCSLCRQISGERLGIVGDSQVCTSILSFFSLLHHMTRSSETCQSRPSNMTLGGWTWQGNTAQIAQVIVLSSICDNALPLIRNIPYKILKEANIQHKKLKELRTNPPRCADTWMFEVPANLSQKHTG